MNNKRRLLLTLTVALGLTAAATTVMAVPLPVGTKLTITPWVSPPMPLLDNGVGCAYGSCFGMGVIAEFFSWTALEPGTDGGIIIGKAQKGGGQDTDLTSTLPGELTAMWDFGGNHGTFFTAPSDAGNVFNDTSCTGAGCGSNTTPRLTDLAVWNTAWGGLTVPMGSAAGCDKTKLSNCTADMVAGIFVNSWTIDPAGTTPRNYELKYSQVVPSVFANFPFRLTLRGAVQLVPPPPPPPPSNVALPTAADISVSATYGQVYPIVSSPRGSPLTCRVGTPPSKGHAGVAGDCSIGVYSPTQGFLFNQSDIFTYIANDGMADSLPGVVMVWGGPVYCSARSLPRQSVTTVANTAVAWDFSSTADLVSGTSAVCALALPPAVGTVTTGSTSRCAGIYQPKPGHIGADKFVYGFVYYYRVSPPDLYPEYCGGTAYGIVDVTVLVPPNLRPTANDISITTVSAQTVNWNPVVADPDGGPRALTCRVGTQPSNGAVTVAADCSSGTYQSNPGFIGTDTFTYIANDDQADSSPGTVTVAVTEPPPSDPCLAQYPISQFGQTGKRGTLSIIFTGNITSHANKEVKVCPGTVLQYQATSTKGPVVCKDKNNTTRGSGSLKVNDHLKCTDKPVGNDKLHIKIKSGVNRKET